MLLALLDARVLSLLEVCCAQAYAVALLPRHRVRRLLPALDLAAHSSEKLLDHLLVEVVVEASWV